MKNLEITCVPLSSSRCALQHQESFYRVGIIIVALFTFIDAECCFVHQMNSVPRGTKQYYLHNSNVFITNRKNNFIHSTFQNHPIYRNHYDIPHPTARTPPIQSKDTNNDDNDEKSVELEFDSLDVVLNRARSRKSLVFIMARVESIFGVSAFPQTPFRFLKRSDLVLIIIAWIPIVNAKGFALGYVIGKGSESSLRGALPRGVTQSNLLQFWPVVLAILLDMLI